MRSLVQFIKWLLVPLFAAAAIACALVAWHGYSLYRDTLAVTSIEEAVAELRARDGYTPIDELPQVYLDAVVAIEDHRFYEHGGVDVIAIGRAALHDLSTLSLEQGGSTITQQLAKNLFFTQEKRFERKVAEVFVAFDLEARYSKREILELYVNSAYFGDGFTGIGQASPGYLGCAPGAMSDCESTLMAGIPNAPSILSMDLEAAWERQRLVVRQMEKYGFDPGDAASDGGSVCYTETAS